MQKSDLPTHIRYNISLFSDNAQASTNGLPTHPASPREPKLRNSTRYHSSGFEYDIHNLRQLSVDVFCDVIESPRGDVRRTKEGPNTT